MRYNKNECFFFMIQQSKKGDGDESKEKSDFFGGYAKFLCIS